MDRDHEQKFDALEYKFGELSKKYKNVKDTSDLIDSFLAYKFGDEFHSFAFRKSKSNGAMGLKNMPVNSGIVDLEAESTNSIVDSSNSDTFRYATATDINIKSEKTDGEITIEDVRTENLEPVVENFNFETIEVKAEKKKRGRKGSNKDKKTTDKNIKTPEVSTECGDCGIIFDNYDHLQVHMNAAHVRYAKLLTNKNGTKKRPAALIESSDDDDKDESTGVDAVAVNGNRAEDLPSTLKELEQRSSYPRTKQTARKPYGGKAPRKHLATKPARSIH